eukprot:EG_transcript_14394
MPIDDAFVQQKQAEAIRAREEAEARAKALESLKAKREAKKQELPAKGVLPVQPEAPTPTSAPTPAPSKVPALGPLPTAELGTASLSPAPSPNPSPRLPQPAPSTLSSNASKSPRAGTAPPPKPSSVLKSAITSPRKAVANLDSSTEAPGGKAPPAPGSLSKDDSRGRLTVSKAKPALAVRIKPASRPEGSTANNKAPLPTTATPSLADHTAQDLNSTTQMAEPPAAKERAPSPLLSPVEASTVRSESTTSEATIATFQLSRLSAEQLAALRETFALFDKDGDGTVTIKELGIVMRSLGQNPTEEELHHMIRDVDRDGSGAIDFEEFAFLMSKQVENQDSSLRYAFAAFDTEKKGRVYAHNLQHGMAALGHHLTEQQCAEIIRAADVAKKGYVDFKAFKAMMSVKP